MKHRSQSGMSISGGRSTHARALWLVAAFAVVASACGGPAFSEEIPAGNTSAVAATHEVSVTPPVHSNAEGRWTAAAYVAGRSGVAEEPEADLVQAGKVPTRPELTPRDPEPSPAPVAEPPVLVATDTEGRQVVEFEADLQRSGSQSEADADFDVDEPATDGTGDAPDITAPSAESETLPPPVIGVGDEMVFALEAELSTEDALPGDIFYATLVDDVVAADGLVLLPRGVRARGRVLESLASRDSDELPVLEIALVELIGAVADTPIEATVVHAEYVEETRDSDSESVVKVLTGAAAGAILGKILGGDDEDALKGGIAGAAAGAAVAYGTRGGHAKLPAGGLITIRLDRPLVVP